MSKQDYHDLLKPEVINTVSGLSLISRIVVEGFTSGLNRSARVGPGMEFSQYRGYEPGDDLRLLDWKMLARSGRYYIKQSEIESQVTIKFIVDSSASMLHKETDLSKMDFVRVLVATLAYMAHKQGDAVGLFALNESDVVSIYPKADKKHYNRLLLELINLTNAGKWPETHISNKRIPNRGGKELTFFLTDMYETDTEISSFVKGLKSARNEVVVLQIMGAAEMDFDYGPNITFEDWETGARIKVDTEKAKTEYLTTLESRLKNIKDELLSNGIQHHIFRMDAHLGEALQLFLKQRKRLS
ncbi:hypothetical protein LCGC14_0417520 [marine sediment metagenome]|uniref:DUF58 domain-containing protein n=1 Tax=marine sediment metagenome TaxID=412755 RepID=A0A0F9TA39_9ZZZZ|nr:DUF58 domain-containing protein [Maribacter sp.]HDZ03461.1 DUF58 domain-containing protein [Maribacter sp.]HEA79284.1 DUF58 domain-containing protein [Maribacter sp.]